MSSRKTACIILAAGKSTRMRSSLPKVLHPLCGRPMLGYVLDQADEFKTGPCVAVLGYKHEQVAACLSGNVRIAVQKEINGTASAVSQALGLLKDFSGDVIVLYGDMPLLKADTLKKLAAEHRRSGAAVTVLTAVVEDAAEYGRIVRDEYSAISGIVEAAEADGYQKEIKEINTGVVCFDKDCLAASLKKVKPRNRKKEYYLTDCIGILYSMGKAIGGMRLKDNREGMGVNSRVELAAANVIMQARLNESYMKQGVSLTAPETVFINHGTKIGEDTVIYPFTVIERDVKIGKNCSIGPFAHLREGTRLADNVCAGNFIEMVRADVGKNVFVKHFSYLGDTRVGRGANIGAGTVTANFDGANKHNTVIGDNAFIGSDTVLIAPVRVGRGAKTGAGSVVNRGRSVPDGGVVAGVPARVLNRSKRR